MSVWYDGECSECGEHTRVVGVDTETALCEECLDNLDYIYCDSCDEYWCGGAIAMLRLKDGRCLCEYCVENEEIDPDEVQEIIPPDIGEVPDYFPVLDSDDEEA